MERDNELKGSRLAKNLNQMFEVSFSVTKVRELRKLRQQKQNIASLSAKRIERRHWISRTNVWHQKKFSTMLYLLKYVTFNWIGMGRV